MPARACVLLSAAYFAACGFYDYRSPNVILEAYSTAELTVPRPSRITIAVTRTACAAPTPQASGQLIVVRPSPNQTCVLSASAPGFLPATLSVDVPATDDPVYEIAGARLARVVWLTPE